MVSLVLFSLITGCLWDRLESPLSYRVLNPQKTLNHQLFLRTYNVSEELCETTDSVVGACKQEVDLKLKAT